MSEANTHDDSSTLAARATNRRRRWVLGLRTSLPLVLFVACAVASSGPATDCEEPAGPLKRLGPEEFRSSGGLTYLSDPGEKFASRADHVLAHTIDDPSRPIHGVFEVGDDPCRVFDLLDEAWTKIQNGHAVDRGDGSYDVEMERDVGYVGGSEGASAEYPTTRWVRVVVYAPSTPTVVTAYPVIP